VHVAHRHIERRVQERGVLERVVELVVAGGLAGDQESAPGQEGGVS